MIVRFIYSPVDGHLDHFLFAIVNILAMNIHVQVFPGLKVLFELQDGI